MEERKGIEELWIGMILGWGTEGKGKGDRREGRGDILTTVSLQPSPFMTHSDG